MYDLCALVALVSVWRFLLLTYVYPRIYIPMLDLKFKMYVQYEALSAPRWSSWYPRKPLEFQVMDSSPDELNLFSYLFLDTIGNDLVCDL